LIQTLAKLRILLSSLCGVALLAMPTHVGAQGMPKNSSTESRIHPDYVDPAAVEKSADGEQIVAPPTLVLNAAPPNMEKREEKLSPPSTTAELLNAVRICMEVVKSNSEIHVGVLVDDLWGYTSPQMRQNSLGRFEKVDYLKGNVTISLQDFGNNVLCRGIGMISDISQMEEIRAALITKLGATPLLETLGLEAVAAKLTRQSSGNSQMDTNNVFIAGDHMIEITSLEKDMSQSGIVDAGLQTFALLTSAPTANSLREHNKKLEAK
jgi:hypothetical protein